MKGKVFLLNDAAGFFIDADRDTNTEFGIIKAKDLKKAKPGSRIKTHTGKVFFVADPSLPDFYRRMIRLPQIITPKDIGSIIAHSGIDRNSSVLEAGAGSGFATCAMASIAKNVVSYEIRKDFAKVARKNVDLIGLDNVTIINKDIKKGIKGKGFDFVLLDLPDPWSLAEKVSRSMKIGGRLCTYSPSIIQVERTIKALPPALRVETLITSNENPWKVEMDRDILRPESSGIKHTAFLLFCRKVSADT